MHQNFAHNLRRVRRALEVSQAELASRIGRRQSYICSLEHGLNPTRTDDVDRIAAALNVPVGFLLSPDAISIPNQTKSEPIAVSA